MKMKMNAVNSSAQRRGFAKEILAVTVGLLAPIALILGAYFLFQKKPVETPKPIDKPVVEHNEVTPPPPAQNPQIPPTKPGPIEPPVFAGNGGQAPVSRVVTADPTYPTRALKKAFPGDPGDMFLRVPDVAVKVGEEFDVDLIMNGGEVIIAATTMHVHFDPLALEFISVTGSLTAGSSGPLATNMKSPGVLIISDINAPKRTQATESPYNAAMTGAAEVYKLRFRAVGDPGQRTFIGGGSTTFHDPGEGTIRPPTQIGDAPFPRIATTNQPEIEFK